MSTSTHRCEVVKITELIEHPNAERLEIVPLFDGGYQTLVAKGSYAPGDLAVFIPPDSIVDASRPEFSFLSDSLNTRVRIRAKKLRGIVSWGLLIPAPIGVNEGDDLAEFYGVEHYDPRMTQEGSSESNQEAFGPQRTKYDLDALLRHVSVFTPGEEVFATEKIHGANCRVTFEGDTLYVGSRTTWKKPHDANQFWRGVNAIPGIELYCRHNPEFTVFGELYGYVQNLRYGAQPGQVWFRVFDIQRTDASWLSADELDQVAVEYDIPQVPVVYRGPFDLAKLKELSDGKSLIPGAQNQMREGIVVRPVIERRDIRVGRVVMKLVGATYLEKDKG